jgi:hypothetical protein
MCPQCGADRQGAIFTSAAEAAAAATIEPPPEQLDIADLRDTGWLKRTVRRKMVTSYPSLAEPGDESRTPAHRPARTGIAMLVGGVVAGLAAGGYWYAHSDDDTPAQSRPAISAAGPVHSGAEAPNDAGDARHASRSRSPSDSRTRPPKAAPAAPAMANADRAPAGQKSEAPQALAQAAASRRAASGVSDARPVVPAQSLAARTATDAPLAASRVEPVASMPPHTTTVSGQVSTATTAASEQAAIAATPVPSPPAAAPATSSGMLATASGPVTPATEPVRPVTPAATATATAAAMPAAKPDVRQTAASIARPSASVASTPASAPRATLAAAPGIAQPVTPATPPASPSHPAEPSRSVTGAVAPAAPAAMMQREPANQKTTPTPAMASLEKSAAPPSHPAEPSRSVTGAVEPAAPAAPAATMQRELANQKTTPTPAMASLEKSAAPPSHPAEPSRSVTNAVASAAPAAPAATMQRQPANQKTTPAPAMASLEKSAAPPSHPAEPSRNMTNAVASAAPAATMQRGPGKQPPNAAPATPVQSQPSLAVARNLSAVQQALASRDLASARRHLRALNANQPHSPEIQQLAADLSRQERARDSAIASARSCAANKEPSCALRSARRAVSLDPRNAQAQASLRQALAVQNESNTEYFRQASTMPKPPVAAMTFDGRWSAGTRHSPAPSQQDDAHVTLFGWGVPTVSKGRGDAH